MDVSEEDHLSISAATDDDWKFLGSSPEEDGDLESRLSQLQSMVADMKIDFHTALSALHSVPHCENQDALNNSTMPDTLSEEKLKLVFNTVQSLQSQLSCLQGQLKETSSKQSLLEDTVSHLKSERNALMEQVTAQQDREKYSSGHESALHSDTSGNVTSPGSLQTSLNSQTYTSDHDSGVATAPPASECHYQETALRVNTMSPHVQSYIDALPHPALDEDYDSDSSLTAAANKSLDLSRSLGNKCAEEAESSDEGDVDDDAEDKFEDAFPGEDISYHQNKEYGSSTPFDSPEQNLISAPKHELSDDQLKRGRVAQEFLETEKKYCSCLWTVLDKIALPLSQSAIASVKELNTMFPPCLQRIYEHHCIFLHRLEERMANWRWHGLLGDICARFFDDNESELLKLYKVYVDDFPYALHQIKKSSRNSARFRKFLAKLQDDNVCDGLDIGAYLLTPIQRFPRYVLLLKQLMKYTEAKHPDHYYIELSLKRLGAMLNKLDTAIEHSMKMVDSGRVHKIRRKRFRASFRSTSSNEEFSARMPSNKYVENNMGMTASGGRMFQLSSRKETEIREHPFISTYNASVPSGYPSFNQPSNYHSSKHPAKDHSPNRPQEQSRVNTPQGRSYMVSPRFNSTPYQSGMSREEAAMMRQATPTRGERPASRPHTPAFQPSSQLDSRFVSTLPLPRPQSRIGSPLTLAQLSSSQRSKSPNHLRDVSNNVSSRCVPEKVMFRDYHFKSSQHSDMVDHHSINSKPTRKESFNNQYVPNEVYLMNGSVKSLQEGAVYESDLLPEHHKSMMAINDYGVYGDSEEEIDDFDEFQRHLPLYQDCVIDQSVQLKKARIPRIKSLSEQQIAASLARSLTEEQFPYGPETPLSFTRSAATKLKPKRTRPSSSALDEIFHAPDPQPEKKSATLPAPRIITTPPSDTSSTKFAWDESMLADESTINTTVTRNRRKLWRKKKSQKSLDETSFNTTLKQGRKRFKDSIKNLFKKKSASKVLMVESENAIVLSENGSVGSTPKNYASSPGLPDATLDKTLEVEKTNAQEVEYLTYQDENGHPCSSV